MLQYVVSIYKTQKLIIQDISRPDKVAEVELSITYVVDSDCLRIKLKC